jgi:hypothetical protein
MIFNQKAKREEIRYSLYFAEGKDSISNRGKMPGCPGPWGLCLSTRKRISCEGRKATLASKNTENTL